MSGRRWWVSGRRSSLAGIVLMVASVLIFSLQDVISAYLARNYPVPFFLMIRYWVFFLFATALAARAEGGLSLVMKPNRPGLQVLRAFVLLLEIAAFAFALRYLKIVELHSLFATAPLIITALSIPLLGEKVGWRRWSAVFIGLIGVLVILRPGADVVQPASFLALFVAALYALYTIMTRLVSRSDPFPTTYWYTAFCGAVVMTAVGPFFWVYPAPLDWIWIGVLCISGVTGHLCLIKALEYAPASTLQPLAHLQLVSATLLGFLIFAEVPDLMTVLGASVIVSSGLYVVWREHQLARRARKKKESSQEGQHDRVSHFSSPIVRP